MRFAGGLADTVAMTMAKLTATMISCGATTLRGRGADGGLAGLGGAGRGRPHPDAAGWGLDGDPGKWFDGGAKLWHSGAP
jgi:hypothetical protein